MTRASAPAVCPPWSGQTARDVMAAAPEALPESATAAQAAAFLDRSPPGCAPVTDPDGRAVGVISRAQVPGREPDAAAGPGCGARPGGVQANDLMSPTVFAVTPETPAAEAAAQMVQMSVHRLFVVDGDGRLVGVVTALDLLRRASPDPRTGR